MKLQTQQHNNGLIWITGYSGAGKTTIARIVSEKIKEIGIPVVFLDGDDLRSIYGRDSFYFSKTHCVTAIDGSKVAIEANQARAIQEGVLNLNFLHGEFGIEIAGLPNEVDAVYGRFVIHAMPEDAETIALQEAWRLLRNGGKLFLEFRTTQYRLMNNGTQLGQAERLTDHYRRLIDFKKICSKLVSLGFNLDFAIEKQGLAAYGSDDPIVGRIVASKSEHLSYTTDFRTVPHKKHD